MKIHQWYSKEEVQEAGLLDRVKENKLTITRTNGRGEEYFGGSLLMASDPNTSYFIDPLFTLMDSLGLNLGVAVDLVLENEGIVQLEQRLEQSNDKVTLLNFHRMYHRYQIRKTGLVISDGQEELDQETDLLEDKVINAQHSTVTDLLTRTGGPEYPAQLLLGDYPLAQTALVMGRFYAGEGDNLSNEVFSRMTEGMSRLVSADLEYFFGIIGEYRDLYELVEDHESYFDSHPISSLKPKGESKPHTAVNYLVSIIHQANKNLNREENTDAVSAFLEEGAKKLTGSKWALSNWHSNHLMGHYVNTRNLSLRNKLVPRYERLVDKALKTGTYNDSSYLEVKDLRQAGILELIKAMNRYDNRGVFMTYAVPRIRGAIIDEIRGMSHTSRSVTRMKKRIQEARNTLSQKLMSEPSLGQIADHLGEDIGKITEAENIAWAPTSIDEMSENEDFSYLNIIAQTTFVDAIAGLEKGSILPIVQDVASTLDEKQAQVIGLYYAANIDSLSEILETFEGKDDVKQDIVRKYDRSGIVSIKNIGSLMGVTESRISQIHKKALETTRTRLRLRHQIAT